jgi:hypothetical protein
MDAKKDQQLEAMLAVVASTLEQALASICGAPRGFAILVFKGDPSVESEGLMLTNIAEQCIREVVVDALDHMEQAEMPTGPAQH